MNAQISFNVQLNSRKWRESRLKIHWICKTASGQDQSGFWKKTNLVAKAVKALDPLLWLSMLSVNASSAMSFTLPFPSAGHPSNFPLKKSTSKHTNKQTKCQLDLYLHSCYFTETTFLKALDLMDCNVA